MNGKNKRKLLRNTKTIFKRKGGGEETENRTKDVFSIKLFSSYFSGFGGDRKIQKNPILMICFGTYVMMMTTVGNQYLHSTLQLQNAYICATSPQHGMRHAKPVRTFYP